MAEDVAGREALGQIPYSFAQFLFIYYNDVHTPEERLRVSLDEIIMLGGLMGDNIPSIFPGCRQSTIPTMFGAYKSKFGLVQINFATLKRTPRKSWYFYQNVIRNNSVI